MRGSEQSQKVYTVDAAQLLVDLVQGSCDAGLQLPVTIRIGTAARSKDSVMLRCSWQAGLLLEVAKRIVTAARREDLGCRSYRKASWEGAQE